MVREALPLLTPVARSLPSLPPSGGVTARSPWAEASSEDVRAATPLRSRTHAFAGDSGVKAGASVSFRSTVGR
ncbi:hypothetical protein VO63_29080 [Streptomyces showdoensis]|uniref:Uncharacterized protein n=1 Tax=Streptomyces showdoensis TaxID=68268 RepID=A0A2P2GFU4_STREW|nr:hypothetical protein VO63_29080 [Streptomyces showdoensis]